MAAPTLVNPTAISVQQGGVDTSSAVVLPAHVADDVGIIYGWARAITATITVDQSWTQLTTWDDTDENDRHFIWWKRFTSGGETNPTISRTNNSGDLFAMGAVYRGVRTTGDPYENLGTPVFSATDNYNLNGITTSSAENLVVVCVGMGDNNATGVTITSTDPAGYTEHYTESAVGGDGCVTIAEAERTNAGATGNINVTYGVAFAGTVNSSGVAFALVPPGGGGGGAAPNTWHYRKTVQGAHFG
jgi:hypothetical protein